jgi:hypothetical protein
MALSPQIKRNHTNDESYPVFILNQVFFVLLFSMLEWHTECRRRTSCLVPLQAILAVYSNWVQIDPIPCKLCANRLFLSCEAIGECQDRMWQQVLWSVSLPRLLATILCLPYSRSWLPQSLCWCHEVRRWLGRDWLGGHSKGMLVHWNFSQKINIIVIVPDGPQNRPRHRLLDGFGSSRSSRIGTFFTKLFCSQ